MQALNTRFAVFFRYRNLLRELVVRDIKVRYRRSVLGLLWTLLFPLLTMLIMTMVFSTLFKSVVPHYSIYFLTGSILFSFNSEATTQAMTTIKGNAGLIKKVYIPRYLFPLASVLSSLINLGFAFTALLLVMLVTGAPFHVTMLLSFIPVAYLTLFTTGLGLMLAALNVFFHDIKYLYGVLALLWMYLTPIFYPISIIPSHFSWFYEWNPMYYYIEYFRSLVMDGVVPGLFPNLICLICGVVTLLIGLCIFYRTQHRFILHI